MIKKRVHISCLTPGPNSRSLSESHVAAMMKNKAALITPLIVNWDGEVTEGNHRLEAHKRLGHDMVDVVIVEDEECYTLDSLVSSRE